MCEENTETNVRTAPEWLINKRKAAIADCSMLYLGKKKPMTESLICFGWECGEGWNGAIADLSYKIEALNLELYPKYRIRCEAEQVKEKFGELRFYYVIRQDPPAWRSFIINVVKRLAVFFSELKIDYAYRKVQDCPAYTRRQYVQITKDEYEKSSSSALKCSNVDYIEKSGNYYKATHYTIYEKYHHVPTRHKACYAISEFLDRAKAKLESWGVTEPMREQRVMTEYMDETVSKYVREAEKACHSLCEKCGMEIGTDYSPRCQTKGWITYLCEKCAKASGGKYSIGEKTDENEK